MVSSAVTISDPSGPLVAHKISHRPRTISTASAWLLALVSVINSSSLPNSTSMSLSINSCHSSKCRSTQNESLRVKEILRPACSAIWMAWRIASLVTSMSQMYPSQKRYWLADTMSSGISLRYNVVAAPRKVFMVRSASGVTITIERPVGSPPEPGCTVKLTPLASEASPKTLPNSSSATLPMNDAVPPKEATPTMVLLAEPPDVSVITSMAS